MTLRIQWIPNNLLLLYPLMVQIQFLHNYQTSSEARITIKVINASSGSLYVMKVKCQEYFRHRVLPNKSCKLSRFSHSFRRIMTPLSTNEVLNLC